jgi:hypothetical protein
MDWIASVEGVDASLNNVHVNVHVLLRHRPRSISRRRGA